MNNELREKFKKLYYKKFNIRLTDEEATKISTDLINLMKVLLKPDKQNKSVSHVEERSEYATITTQQYT